jgi:hypothetical protein
MAEVVKCLPSKHESQNSISPVPPKNSNNQPTNQPNKETTTKNYKESHFIRMLREEAGVPNGTIVFTDGTQNPKDLDNS